jgi:hypothetical protein
MTSLRTILVLAILSLTLSCVVHAQDAACVEGGFGMVRGPGYAFLLKAPAGWVIDPVSGTAQGLPAVFYPKGSSWAESPAVAYARARPRTKSVSIVEETVKAAVEALRAQGNPEYRAKFLKTIRTSDGKEGMVYRFSGTKTGDIEATVYFVEKRTIDFVTLSCRSEKVFDSALPALEKLASSYQFQPDKIPSDPSKQGFFQDGTPKD